MDEEKRRSPQEKKALALQKDHFSPSEYPHAFRKQWPQKRARAERAHRRKVNQTLKALNEINEGTSPAFTKRERARKWGSITLGDRVEGTLSTRTRRLAWNYFKTPYQSAFHRERFAAFLKSLMEGRSSTSKEIALRFQELLEREDFSGTLPQLRLAQARAWFESFSQEEPLYEEALRRWIQEVLR